MREFKRSLIAERLRELRSEKNLGQNQVASDLNLSNASISYWETGKQEPGALALFKLAQYYGVSVDYILGLEE